MTEMACPLNQSDAFERTCKRLGMSVTRFEQASGRCLVQSRSFPLLGQFHLISRGPVAIDSPSYVEMLERVRRSMKGPLVVNAPNGVKTGGGLKIARGAEIALLDLTRADQMRTRLNQKWRNQLKKAEASNLRVIDQALDWSKHAWFLNAEAQQQKDRGYKSYPAAFLLAFAAENKGQARLYSAILDGQPIAGMLVLKHGSMATYQAGVTLPQGRQSCAHNLLLWRIMCDLERKGYSHLDLGRADLSPGLRRFKIGTGARIDHLAGTYFFHHWFPPSASKIRHDPIASTSRA